MNSRGRILRFTLPVLSAALAVLLAVAAAQAVGPSRGFTEPSPPESCPGSHWVGIWAASPSDAASYASEGLAGRTVRTVITPLGSGTTVRIRFSNRLGAAPLRIRSASIARQSGDAGIRGTTLRPLRFEGGAAVTVPAHGTVRSDPLTFRISTLDHIAISTWVDPGSDGLPTKHFDGRQTSYLTAASAGDRTKDRSASAFGTATTVRYLVAGVDARAPMRFGSVVTFGDSITDGYQDQGSRFQGIDRDVRYPDFLARRLGAGNTPRLSVLNAGIGGNRILRGPQGPTFGPSGLSRLGPDVIAQSGVRDVIVLEGINDILQSGASASEVAGGLKKVVGRLRASGSRVLLGTLTPTGGFPLTAAGQRARVRVNRWIRGQGAADGVIDFDRALRDPARPLRMLPAYDSGDGLHPSAAGYRAMAAAIPLAQLRSGCPPR